MQPEKLTKLPSKVSLEFRVLNILNVLTKDGAGMTCLKIVELLNVNNRGGVSSALSFLKRKNLACFERDGGSACMYMPTPKGEDYMKYFYIAIQKDLLIALSKIASAGSLEEVQTVIADLLERLSASEKTN